MTPEPLSGPPERESPVDVSDIGESCAVAVCALSIFLSGSVIGFIIGAVLF